MKQRYFGATVVSRPVSEAEVLFTFGAGAVTQQNPWACVCMNMGNSIVVCMVHVYDEAATGTSMP